MTAASPTTDLDRLWADYKADPTDRARRDPLIVHYAPLVKFVAGRVASGLPHTIDQADLVSYGILGLIDAIEKFDLGRGFKFETYAISRIRGAMLDELRAIDWVPRSVRAKARTLEQAFASLEAKLHRAPSEPELAEALDVSVGELQTMLGQISFTGLVALDELLGGSERGEGMTLGDTITDASPGPLAAYEVTELKERLADAIRALPEREKTVVGLYYYEGLTLAEIGSILGVTESRVCQLHTKAVLHLRSRVSSIVDDRVD
ncbi:MAG: FliA/WhiG family RNA polymerase sigma factor [Actinomycetota bacterium]|nr:FliA/WhiG family RNA polymerase sigma factor [Actinomycetota bacterium]